MLSDNLKTIRKNKGYSQETMAEQLHIVRQTVSKWEKGLSVPDAEMLNKISELFEVPVSVLLGGGIPEPVVNGGESSSASNNSNESKPDASSHESLNAIAQQLAILNEQLAGRAARRRKLIRRVLLGSLAAIIVFMVLWYTAYYFYRVKPRQNAVLTEAHLICTLDGEEYSYGIKYDENYQIVEAGGSSFVADHVVVEQYDDANVLMAQIEDYFTERGGTVEYVE